MSAITSNAVKKLYTVKRQMIYDALMSVSTVIPEGSYDYDWLSLWLRIAQTGSDTSNTIPLKPLTIIETEDGQVLNTYTELSRLRSDVVPLVDGDNEGQQKISQLQSSCTPPKAVVAYGSNAAVECLSAWILEPALSSPGPCLQAHLPPTASPTLKELQDLLTQHKKNRPLHEELAWEALDNPICVSRAAQFICDLGSIALGEMPVLSWRVRTDLGTAPVYVADFIQKV